MNVQGQKSKICKLAAVSPILAILSVVILPPLAFLMKPIAPQDMLTLGMAWLPPLASLVLGAVALRRIKRANGLLKGRSLAISGLLLSILVTLTLAPLTIFFIARYSRTQLIKIDNATRTTTVTLSNKNTSRAVMGLVILVTGHVEGTATINLKGFREYRIDKGRVRLKICTDWYSDECIIKYEPINVNSGFLDIRYCFLLL